MFRPASSQITSGQGDYNFANTLNKLARSLIYKIILNIFPNKLGLPGTTALQQVTIQT